jgi:putative component of toxin-antitoxin plasmid stabilization module
LTEELSDEARELVGAAILEILQADGPSACGTRFGRQLGDGVFEFRLDGDPHPWIDAARRSRGKKPTGERLEAERVQYRLFCHAHGDRLILLLGAYDKGKDVSKKRQQEEIATAKARLEMWARQERLKARAAQRGTSSRPAKKRP